MSSPPCSPPAKANAAPAASGTSPNKAAKASPQQTSNSSPPGTSSGLDPAEVTLRKRAPPSLPRRDVDVYVTTK